MPLATARKEGSHPMSKASFRGQRGHSSSSAIWRLVVSMPSLYWFWKAAPLASPHTHHPDAPQAARGGLLGSRELACRACRPREERYRGLDCFASALHHGRLHRSRRDLHVQERGAFQLWHPSRLSRSSVPEHFIRVAHRERSRSRRREAPRLQVLSVATSSTVPSPPTAGWRRTRF